MKDKKYLVAVAGFSDFGPVRLNLLLSYFKKAEKIWQAKENELRKTGLNEKIITKFIEYRNCFNFPKYFRGLKSFGVKVYTLNAKGYPPNLKGIPDAPRVLYIRGSIKKIDTKSVAIVGTRKMTDYGAKIARIFATGLVKHGYTVISGLALGIDAEAHKAAFNAGGRTIAVLASGLDIISPVVNKPLALSFIKSRGAVISEKPLGYFPQPYDFPIRDRIISGMAKGVLVIEGTMKSGTFYTVKAALDQGRSVFAVPGPITSITSEGPNYLIQNGAKLVTKVEDILEELA